MIDFSVSYWQLMLYKKTRILFPEDFKPLASFHAIIDLFLSKLLILMQKPGVEWHAQRFHIGTFLAKPGANDKLSQLKIILDCVSYSREI